MVERVQLSRKKGWRKPENTVVVARPSKWGNPFTVDEFGLPSALRMFRTAVHDGWSPSDLDQDLPDEVWSSAYEKSQTWRRRIGHHGWHVIEVARAELAGKNLACWCPLDQPCHADVLIELVNA